MVSRRQPCVQPPAKHYFSLCPSLSHSQSAYSMLIHNWSWNCCVYGYIKSWVKKKEENEHTCDVQTASYTDKTTFQGSIDNIWLVRFHFFSRYANDTQTHTKWLSDEVNFSSCGSFKVKNRIIQPSRLCEAYKPDASKCSVFEHCWMCWGTISLFV